MAATDPFANAVESFSAPMEQLIIALGQGLATAQNDLDRNSIQTQEAIDADPILSQYGLQATWYQFPTVTLQLKMSLSIAEEQTSTTSGGTSPLPRRIRLVAQPLSASFQKQFDFDAQAATEINLTIVPVPPPRNANALNSPSTSMTQDAVTAKALASTAPFVRVKNAQGQIVDPAGNVYVMAVNFNASARLWYVIQYAPSNASITPIVVAVDDATQTVRQISPPVPGQ
jgi:hypothetical protein